LPEEGEGARGRQLTLLSRLMHARRSSAALREALDTSKALEDEDSARGATVRRARRMSERASRVPSELQEKITDTTTRLYGTWTRAKADEDFAAVAPLLKTSLELSRRYAELFDVDHPLDAFIDEHDPGFTAASVTALFSELREGLRPIAQVLMAAPLPDRAFMERAFPAEAQLKFSRRLAEAVGYDFSRGRQDLTAHPFMIRLGGGDIRITTRVTDDPMGALFGTVHEAGHALYEQHIDAAYEGTILGHGTSTAVHESQSRLWENIVGRSEAFWTPHYGALQDTFRRALGDVPLTQFIRAINAVERSKIRVHADEVTYNLHIMVRFELERALLEGTLDVDELPEAWNARMKEDLDLTIERPSEGVLQDVHWYCMPIGGAFQGYALGNVMAAQFMEAAESSVPALWRAIAAGDTSKLRRFLADAIYRHGSRYTPDELLERVTGGPLRVEPFLNYLRKKFSALYDLEL
ncbi:MAG: carboxypeptidase M32, partial [Myxococcota bacterium]